MERFGFGVGMEMRFPFSPNSGKNFGTYRGAELQGLRYFGENRLKVVRISAGYGKSPRHLGDEFQYVDENGFQQQESIEVPAYRTMSGWNLKAAYQAHLTKNDKKGGGFYLFGGLQYENNEVMVEYDVTDQERKKFEVPEDETLDETALYLEYGMGWELNLEPGLIFFDLRMTQSFSGLFSTGGASSSGAEKLDYHVPAYYVVPRVGFRY